MVSKMQNEKEKDLIIESRFHRQLIGPKGENIQKIRDDFANVQVNLYFRFNATSSLHMMTILYLLLLKLMTTKTTLI